MIQGTLANLIKKINYTGLIISIFIIGIIGIELQRFEPYPMFGFLFPVLLIMLLSVILILQLCLKELQEFQKNCESEDIRKYCESLFAEKSNSVLLVIYIIMIIVYFVCIYRLQFVEINLMGLYILILGGGTFFLALINYEVCVRLTKALKEAEKNKKCIKYNELYPRDTTWLLYFFHFHKVLKNAALIVSMLFVLENSMLFVANYDKLNLPTLSDENNILDIFKNLQIEWWVIWTYIFVTIVLALPIMTRLRNKRLNNIVSYIQTDFNEKMTNSYTMDDMKDNLQKYSSILNIIQAVQNSLKETYLPHSIDRLVSLGASLLTCFAHLISFIMIFLPILPK